MDLVRLAIPRRVYTQSHADYLIEVFEDLVVARGQLTGFAIRWQPPAMRHFTAKFAPLAA
jgi:tryptophanase